MKRPCLPAATLPAPVHQGVRLWLLFVGKPRDVHANAIARDYIERAARFARLRDARDPARAFDPVERQPSSRKVALDPQGRLFSSAEFTALIAAPEMEGWMSPSWWAGPTACRKAGPSAPGTASRWTPLTLPHELARASWPSRSTGRSPPCAGILTLDSAVC